MVVVVVDDDAPTRRLFGRVLRAAGYGVREAADGMEAVAIAVAEPIALVLADVRMPGVDGVELVGSLRECGIAAPVVLTSADAAVDPRLPGVPFLPQPVDLAALRALVARRVG